MGVMGVNGEREQAPELSFEALWREAAPKVRAFIAALVGDRHLREDILQNAAMAAYRKFGQYDPERPFAAWVVGIARFEVLRMRRSAAREKLVFDTEVVEKVTVAYQQSLEEYDVRRAALAKCVDSLPDDKRALLRLRYQEALAYSEIAARLHSREGAVRTMLCRVRSGLEACIRWRLEMEGLKA